MQLTKRKSHLWNVCIFYKHRGHHWPVKGHSWAEFSTVWVNMVLQMAGRVSAERSTS